MFWGKSEAEPVEKYRLRQGLKEAMIRAKIPTIERSFHLFRHTYVSFMRHEVGADRVMKQVAYTHETDDDRALIQKAVQGLFSGTQE